MKNHKKLPVFLTIFMLIAFATSIFAQTSEYEYYNRFMEMYQKIHAKHVGPNGETLSYFSPEGAPYHSVESMVIEAPDHGHETTSEAYSFWIWMEALYARLTGDFSKLNKAWETMEQQIIPTSDIQPCADAYDPGSPAAYMQENLTPEKYPVLIQPTVPVGNDPISQDLADTYGTWEIYGMHWLLDCDNFYGYGNWGDGESKPSYINTFQRGPQESTWETVPHPSHEMFNWGSSSGFLPLFIDDPNGYKPQWRYTNAPDADARVVQAMYWAYEYAKKLGIDDPSQVLPIDETKKMGDYLRLSFFDKYFKTIGCQSESDAGQDYDSAHYLLGWYYAWGGSANTEEPWAWRIGSSSAHFGYQNPMAAYALSQLDHFKPASPRASDDWAISLQRQLEFYRWLQTDEGAIAGGATNNLMVENPGGQDYNYSPYPANASTFYGMIYDEKPVYHDPPSNQWFGMQAWSMERMCELFYLTDIPLVNEVVTKWIGWVKGVVNITGTSYEIPNQLAWTGQPDTWNPANPGSNSNLHVNVVNYTQDPGVTAALAKALIYYAAGTRRRGNLDDSARSLAKQLLDRMWLKKDDLGVGLPEERGDFLERFFDQAVYVPSGFSGTMVNGDEIKPGVTFYELRTEYANDPNYQYMLQCYNEGTVPVFTFHRLWHQTDVAMAMAEYAIHFDEIPPINLPPAINITSPEDGIRVLEGNNVEITIEASDFDGTIERVELFITGSADPVILTAAPYNYTIENITEGFYTLRAVAVDNGGQTAEDSVSIEVSRIPMGDIRPLYTCKKTEINTQQIEAHLNIRNNSNEDIDLSELTVRYYYDRESNVQQIFNCYYAIIGASNVIASFKDTDELKYYLQLNFNSVTLPANSETGQIQISINNQNWSVYDQSNDWSFNPDLLNYDEWYKITIHRNGELIWGLPDHEPVSYNLNLTSPLPGQQYLTGDDVLVQAEVVSNDASHNPVVTFFQNNVEIGTDDTAPYQVTVSNIVAGNYTYYASSPSPEGQEVISDSASITVADPYLDGSMIIIPDPGNIKPGDDVELRVNVETNIPGPVTVDFNVNGNIIASDSTPPYTAIIENIAIGQYDIFAVITANNGTVLTIDTVILDIIDIPYLNVNITSPANNSLVAQGSLVPVLFDIDTNQTVSATRLYLDNVLEMTDTTAPYDLSFTAQDDVSVTVEVDARTLTGNDSVNVRVQIPQKPEVTILAPANGTQHTVGQPIDIQIQATDADGSISEVRIYDVVGSVETLLAALPGQAGNIYNYTWNGTGLGNHTIKAVATDNDNSDSDPDEVNIEVAEAGEITIRYEMNSWPSGMSVNVFITNNTDQDITDWTLIWEFPNNQQITNIWNANYTQSGQSVEVSTSHGWNKLIPSGATRNIFGFNGTHTGTNDKPTAFYLNGIPLQIVE